MDINQNYREAVKTIKEAIPVSYTHLSVNACVFGYSAGKALVPGQVNLTGKNNYCTTDFEQAADTGLTLIDLGMSDSSFFRNAKDGDFTIINTGSTVYTQEYGDPRWITVSEY